MKIRVFRSPEGVGGQGAGGQVADAGGRAAPPLTLGTEGQQGSSGQGGGGASGEQVPNPTAGSAGQQAPAFELDKWDGSSLDVLPEPHRPYVKRYGEILSKKQEEAQRVAMEKAAAERASLEQGWAAKQREWDAAKANYEKGISPELTKLRGELELARKLGEASADPRIAEFEKKIAEQTAKMQELEQFRVEAERQEALRMEEQDKRELEAFKQKYAKELADKPRREKIMENIKLGWSDEAAVHLSAMSDKEQKLALDYANKYKLGGEQHMVAVEYARGMAEPEGGNASSSLVSGADGGRNPSGGRDINSMSIDEARRAAAEEVLKGRK